MLLTCDKWFVACQAKNYPGVAFPAKLYWPSRPDGFTMREMIDVNFGKFRIFTFAGVKEPQKSHEDAGYRMVPFGYAVGLGDQDVCSSVTEVPTHFCHNALTMPMGSPVQANEFEAQPHPWHPLHAFDGEHIMRTRQQPMKDLLKNPIHFPRKQNSSLTSTAQHGLPPFPIENILQRNPAIQKMIKKTMNDLSKIIQTREV